MLMRIREAVEKYLQLGGGYGRSVALSSFGMSPEATRQFFSALDEDYQISRYMHFALEAGNPYSINGFPQTHVVIDREVETIL